MAARGSDREFLKDKIRILNEECADKKQMVEVLTRVEEELKTQIGEWEKEVREIRPLCAQKETQLSEAEDFVKKGNLKVVELKEQIAHNTVDIEKMRRQEEDTLRNTIQAQERTDNLKAQLKHKGGLSL
ncbi:uncharacterized protein LOC142351809 [Convolutriloba macropyga]|uniref:uncharacterized protein LOC142351809 n=1 Tax=Convolutriloba macropyga TaxID=536237 RepID=UPI003F51BC8F